MDPTQLLKQLEAFSNATSQEVGNEDRMKIIAACEKIRNQLESPLEITARLMFGGYEGTALRLAIDMKLIDRLVESKGPVKAEVLAKETGQDVLLIVRVLRMLAASSLLEEAGKDTFVATRRVAAYVAGSPLREAVVHLSSKLTTIGSLPDYFASTGYKNPNDANDGPFQFAHHTALHYFDWLSNKPHLLRAYNVTMAVQRLNRGQQWFEFYPVEDKLRVNDASRILLVDVGGGAGHDLINFQAKFPELPGGLVLEDLPAVTETAKLPQSIQVVGHDFFKPHPRAIHGAKAYYLRTVLHDWPDKQAAMILENIRNVMSNDSILLVNENVLPDLNVSLYQCQLDFNMMASYSALDRTEEQFGELFDLIGLKIASVWKPKDFVPGSGTLFEVVLKDE